MSALRRFALHPATLCALLLVLCVLVSLPRLEMGGSSDDWSYIWSARMLAATGHIVYNGWAAAIIGWQLYWGALFIKLFGFSFTALRVAGLLLSIGCTVLMQRLLVRFGATERNASIATLTLVLGPVFLPLSFSFMTDNPGMFVLLLCLYGCARAVTAPTTPAAIGWLIFAAATNIAGGTVRQIVWLGVLIVVPSAGWLLRRRKGVVPTVVALWLVGTAAILFCLHWYKRQPGMWAEPLLTRHNNGSNLWIAPPHLLLRALLCCMLLGMPVFIALLARVPVSLRLWRNASLLTALPVTALLLYGIRHTVYRGMIPFSSGEVSAKGLQTTLLVGQQPNALSFAVRAVLTYLVVATTMALAAMLVWAWRRSSVPPVEAARTPGTAPGSLSAYSAAVLLGPLFFAYLALIVTRTTIFDRYFLLLLFVAFVPFVRLYQRQIAVRLPAVSIALVAVVAVFSTAGLHDRFAQGRARLGAVQELTAAAVPRTQIRAGFEYDGWTQLTATGRVRHDPTHAWDDGPCAMNMADRTPAVQGHFVLAYDPGTCFAASPFAPVPYRTWLPPYNQAIYIRELR